MSTGFNFGTPAAATTQSSLASKRPIGLTLGTPAASNTGFKIPATAHPSAFGNTTAQPAANPGSAFSFNTPATAATGLGGGLGGALTLGTAAVQPAKTTASLTLGGFGATSTAASAATGFTGFGTAVAAASTGLTGGLAAGGLPTGGLGTGLTGALGTGLTGALSTGLTGGLGGGLSGLGAASTAGTGIFATSVAAVPKGLGGLDPKTSLASGGASTSKPGDNKAAKETNVPAEVAVTVAEYKEYVKRQKSTRENNTRMSSKPIYKVQEEVASLRHLLAAVTNALQRNAVAIQKLKVDSAGELKHAEVAQRTKDTSPGLQYEHTAPTVYFRSLAEEFEGCMCKYRQQIEDMEKHLASLNTSTMLTPQELSQLLSKVHASMLSLAAQMHAVHEEVKAQKEHYLNYRRIFHGDATDLFEKRRRAAQAKAGAIPGNAVGPQPFGPHSGRR